MGIMDKVRGLLKGRERQVKRGIDTASNKVERTVGPKHARHVDAASQKAKEAVDKLAREGGDTPQSAPPAPGTTADQPSAEPTQDPPAS